jgi:glycosyltransferase involved in cell wall biosynthesis
MKIKVAIIDHLGAHGSSHHFYLFGQARGLIENGVNVSLYTNSSTTNPKIQSLGFYQFYQNIFNSSNKLISLIRYLLGSIRSHFHARLNSCNIFHYHLFGASSLVLFNMFLAKLLFGKIVVTIHDVRSFSSNAESVFYTRLIYFLTDSILTHNRFSRKEIVRYHKSLDKKITIIPHGNYLPFIDLHEDQEESRLKLGIDLDKKVLLFFGMIKKVKNLDLLLLAMREIIKRNSKVILLIAGKPWKDDFSYYQEIIDRLKIHNNCVLNIKFIAHQDVKHYYCATDIVILPYKEIYQSGVLMMSLCFGKPVVISDLDSFKEIVNDQETALFFKSGDTSSLSNVINSALENHDLLEKVRTQGFELVKTKYSWIEIGRQTRDAYYKINYFCKK